MKVEIAVVHEGIEEGSVQTWAQLERAQVSIVFYR